MRYFCLADTEPPGDGRPLHGAPQRVVKTIFPSDNSNGGQKPLAIFAAVSAESIAAPEKAHGAGGG